MPLPPLVLQKAAAKEHRENDVDLLTALANTVGCQ